MNRMLVTAAVVLVGLCCGANNLWAGDIEAPLAPLARKTPSLRRG